MKYGPIYLFFLIFLFTATPNVLSAEDKEQNQAEESVSETNSESEKTPEQRAPKLKVKMSDEMQAKEDAFQAKFKTLTDKQKAIVSQMEIDFMKTTQPDIDILHVANQISKCSYSSSAKNKLIEKAFQKYQQERNDVQNQMWADFDRKYKGQIDFMDEKELRHHLYLQFNIATSTAASLIKVKGSKADAREWCKIGLNTIDVRA